MFDKRISTLFLLGLALNLVGCYDEGLIIENIDGTVLLPEELVDRTYLLDGTEQVVNDVRSIGPVYLGLYADILEPNRVATYPHPVVGPTFDGANVGDAFPYGGTSIGALRPMCLEALQCKVVSGRFVDWDGMADWFANYLGEPILDYFGNPAESGEFIRQTCMEAFNHTADFELGLTVYEDRDGNDVFDEGDLDFVLRNDGFYEAKFTLWQQEYFENPETGDGMTLWGYMDTPAPGTGTFSSCIPGGAITRTIDYNQNFQAGTTARDILNRPSKYVGIGDVISGDQGDGVYGWKFEDIHDNPELRLNFEVTQ